MRNNNIIGNKYEMVLVLEKSNVKRNGCYLYKCRCDCGKVFYATKGNLEKVHHKSCGCKRNQNISKGNFKHGLIYTREYKICTDAIRRCKDKNRKTSKNYIGRGITAYELWEKDIGLFTQYMIDNFGKCPENYSIDRIKNNEGYFPNNVRWASKQEQLTNRRLMPSNKTGYNGVMINEKGKFVSYLYNNKKQIRFGTFNTLEEALKPRNKYIIDNNLPHKIQ